MMTSRIYVVKDMKDNTERLVDAGNPSQAIRHVVRGKFSAKPADQRDVARLVKSGVDVEEAGKDDAA